MRRYVGELLLGTGVVHILVSAAGSRRALVAIHRAGYLGAVGRDPARHAALWSLATGGLLCTLGQLARSAQARTGTVPRSLGWGLLALATPGAVLLPASGFWLLLGQALLVLTGSEPVPPTAPAAPVPPTPAQGRWQRLRRVLRGG